MTIKFSEQRCKGCGFCVEFCPKHVLVFTDDMNDLGYHYAVVKDINTCTGCGICALMCPDVLIEIEVA